MYLQVPWGKLTALNMHVSLCSKAISGFYLGISSGGGGGGGGGEAHGSRGLTSEERVDFIIWQYLLGGRGSWGGS